MQLGAWQLDTINGGRFRIDGGVLFGLVPKSLWALLATADEQNRVGCGNRCVLARDGRHTVLIDTGCGTKYTPLDRKFYAMEEGEPLLEDLAALGVAPADIDTVVLTHLHFDHVGGATRHDRQGQLVPTFPKARYVVSRLEWEDATIGGPALQTAYSLDNLLPLAETGQLVLLDGDPAIVPGLTAIRTGGHTRGHLAVKFCSAATDRASSSATCAPPPPTCVACGARPTTFTRWRRAAASRSFSARRPKAVGWFSGTTIRRWPPATWPAIPSASSSSKNRARGSDRGLRPERSVGRRVSGATHPADASP